MSNAILLASGLGSRMRPITNTIPKPLVTVNDVPLIETVIDTLNRAGVNMIYVVVGYLSEQFAYLPNKYKNVTIIYNKDYNIANNISSLYYAADKLAEGDCYICEADLYIPDTSILEQLPIKSCYYGRFVAGYSEDWVFEQDTTGKITRVGKGGTNCYNMVGISYIKGSDARTLAKKIKHCYQQDTYKNKFWDEVVDENLHELELSVYPVSEGQIIEIDTVEELNNVRLSYSPE